MRPCYPIPTLLRHSGHSRCEDCGTLKSQNPLRSGVIGGVRGFYYCEVQKEEFKLAAQDHLIGYSILKSLFVGVQDSFCTSTVTTTSAQDRNVCFVAFGSSTRSSGPMGCLMSPRMDSDSDEEQEATPTPGHAQAAPGATPPTPPVRRKPTPSTLTLFLSLKNGSWH